MKWNRSTGKSVRTISAEALEQFSASDDSLAGMIELNHIEVRDFMVLSFICDQSELGVEQLMSALGLSRESIVDCIDRLGNARLVVHRRVASVTDPKDYVTPTPDGRRLARRVLEGVRNVAQS